MNEPTVTFTGNLTETPSIRYTPTGRSVAGFTVACNPRVQDPTGEWVDGTPVFWTCQAWNSLAEHIADSLSKGDRVLVTGRVKANVWTPTDGPNAGVEQRRLEVLVDEIGPSLRFASTTTTRLERTTTPPGAGQSDGAEPPF